MRNRSQVLKLWSIIITFILLYVSFSYTKLIYFILGLD